MLSQSQFVKAAMAAALAAVVPGVAAAQSTPIPNGSFENTPGDFEPPTGFTGVGPDVLVQDEGEAEGPQTPFGEQYVGFGNGGGFTNLFLDLPVNGAGDPAVTAFVFSASFALRTLGDEENTAGDTGTITLGIQDLGEPAFVGTVLQIPRSALNTTTFTEFSVALPASTVTPGQNIRLFIDKNPGVGFFVADNLTLTAIPEPASLGLLALGGLGLLARRRRGA